MAKKLTKRLAFNFLRSYFDVLNELENDSDKLSYLLAIIDKQFLDEDPEGLSFLSNLCYESQRHSIEQSVKGYKTKMKTDLLGNPLELPTKDPSQGGGQGGGQAPSVQEEEKGKEKSILIYSVLSPPDGVDVLHFYIAKSFHKMFYDSKQNKSLKEAKLNTWVNTVRLILDVDDIPTIQLVGIKHFLQAGINKDKGVKSFWSDTIFSINALRKKSDDGTYYIDRIKQDAKRWIERNPEKEEEIYKAHQRLIEAANG